MGNVLIIKHLDRLQNTGDKKELFQVMFTKYERSISDKINRLMAVVSQVEEHFN